MDKEKRKQKFKKRLYQHNVMLIKFLAKLSRGKAVGIIKRQLLRSGTSMGANSFEAEGSSSKKDYINFFHYCLKSSNESKFWLLSLRNSNLIPENLIVECDDLIRETSELADIFGASILTMKGKRNLKEKEKSDL